MRSKFPVSLLLLSLLHSIYCFPTAYVDFYVCQQKDGNFPKPGSSCRSYYKCENWMVVEIVCPEYQNFFPAKGYCVWPEEYPCHETPKAKECPLPNGKFMKPGTRCKEYYECRKGVSKEKKCGGELLFDHGRGRCEYPEFVICPEVLTTISQSMPAITSAFENTNTKGNIITATARPILSTKRLTTDDSSEEGSSSEEDSSSKENNRSSTTAENKSTITSTSTRFKSTPSTESITKPVTKTITSTSTRFKSTPSTESITKPVTKTISKNNFTKQTEGSTDGSISKKFTLHDKSTSGTRPLEIKDVSTTANLDITDSVTLNIFCPEPNGYFPHPKNKHKFVACIGNIPTVMDCPSNLVYDHERRSCEYDKTRF